MDLGEDEYHLLNSLFKGTKIGDALAGLDESAAANLSEYFSRWMRNGLLARYEYTAEQPKRNAA